MDQLPALQLSVNGFSLDLFDCGVAVLPEEFIKG
jgi:hypothetical protein